LISTFSSLDGLNFLDLFAGSGAVGVEALSRGVALVDAVESNPTSAKVCERNFALISNLSGVGKFKVHQKTVFEFLNHTAADSYEIIYIDPPYEVENSEVAIERDSKSKAFSWPAGLSEAKVRSYGAGAIHYGVLSEHNQSKNG
jgi:16S rRNA (guanine966-N2)-methyltransferase